MAGSAYNEVYFWVLVDEVVDNQQVPTECSPKIILQDTMVDG